ncbi:MAG: hypothetical protein O7D93_07695 [Acidobacteria bacterium]|nr:hypothetical protein [Acidobacteriota bacterium]MCZ6877539.1 hypothetical protein [Acidobacteriota bacterium]
MLKKVLKVIAVALVLWEVTMLSLILIPSDPYSRIPGRRLTGEEVPGPVTDWSFAREYGSVSIEVRPSDPYSVNIGSLVYNGDLYVTSAAGGESRWAQYLVQDPNMRVRVGGKVYKARGTRIEDLDMVNEVFDSRRRRTPGQEETTPRERTPEQTARNARVWLFRIDSL